MSERQEAVLARLEGYFQGRGYSTIETGLAGMRMYMVFMKSSLYVFNLTNLDRGEALDQDRFQRFEEMVRRQFKRVDTDHVVFLNLLLTEEPERLSVLESMEPDMERKTISIYWVVDTEAGALVIPKRQPRNLLGIEKDLKMLLDTGSVPSFQLRRVDSSMGFTYGLMFLNLLVWFLMEMGGGSTDVGVLLRFGAMQPALVLGEGQVWRMFTAMFLHIGLGHLLFNSFSLYIFGSRLERYLKGREFLGVYLAAGLAGSCFSLLGALLFRPDVVSAGASGAIYGLMGSILVLSRAAGRSVEDLSSYSLWMIFLVGMLYSILNVHVDAAAHLGGFIGGILATLPLVRARRHRGD
ncbi:rhomboid family intramembrane serine protease [Anaerotalea alkaliphila]|uniref:Rhomboid family intramembrane serine protease n=1 Tax=Anaerotalea alkaliphila TaxID=2662126 RepID=A0A7X5HTR2_9FIRM|nr:rhomboid family intramembrane serine protease [Anaerotalea alkaliphila]NDL66385.1 rhomboid family intramembrane serine protease [Anaerotalea alkaliphila]